MVFSSVVDAFPAYDEPDESVLSTEHFRAFWISTLYWSAMAYLSATQYTKQMFVNPRAMKSHLTPFHSLLRSTKLCRHSTQFAHSSGTTAETLASIMPLKMMSRTWLLLVENKKVHHWLPYKAYIFKNMHIQYYSTSPGLQQFTPEKCYECIAWAIVTLSKKGCGNQ